MLRSLLATVCGVAALSGVVAQQNPLLYISFHGGKSGLNTISSFDLQGNSVQPDVLVGSDADELRTAILMPSGNLLVASAHKTDSSILQFGACDGNGQRDFIGEFITDDVSHPYGLVLGTDMATSSNVLWVTNQDTFDITQFDAMSGTFQEQVRQFGSEELRSLAFDTTKSVLYVANEDEQAVLAYDTNSNTWSTSLSFSNITDPVGLFIDNNARLLFAGSNGGEGASNVYAFDLDTRLLVQTFTDPGLNHPAGMVSYGGILYVISQAAGTLMQFNVSTGEVVGTLISSFEDVPEQIMLSPC